MKRFKTVDAYVHAQDDWHDEVVKLLPPLILDAEGLDKGMSILRESFAEVAARHGLDEESGNVVSLKKSAS